LLGTARRNGTPSAALTAEMGRAERLIRLAAWLDRQIPTSGAGRKAPFRRLRRRHVTIGQADPGIGGDPRRHRWWSAQPN